MRRLPRLLRTYFQGDYYFQCDYFQCDYFRCAYFRRDYRRDYSLGHYVLPRPLPRRLRTAAATT